MTRAITSFVLIKDGLFPFVVTREDKTVYLDALETANQDNLNPRINLIAKLQRAQFIKAMAMFETVLPEHENIASLNNLQKIAENTATGREK